MTKDLHERTVRPLIATLAALATTGAAIAQPAEAAPTPSGQLGNFSVSLAVKDIDASLAFYRKLGFQVVGGKLEQKWLVLQNGSAKIGLFQGMFEKNMLTFNPGWNDRKEPLAQFQDVRELQRAFKSQGLKVAPEVDEGTEGPGHFMLTDPDGNPLLFDQHVPKPAR